MESRSFYNEILTEHNIHPEFKHDLPDADLVLEGVNPNCGDDIFLKLKFIAKQSTLFKKYPSTGEIAVLKDDEISNLLYASSCRMSKKGFSVFKIYFNFYCLEYC